VAVWTEADYIEHIEPFYNPKRLHSALCYQSLVDFEKQINYKQNFLNHCPFLEGISTIFIAWEHGLLDDFARNMVKDNGGEGWLIPS